MTEHNDRNDQSGNADSHDDKPSYDDINVPVVVMIGVISTLVTFISIAFLQGLYNHWHESFVVERQINQVDVDRDEKLAAQKAQLLPNDDTGRIGIDQGMENALKKFRGQGPAQHNH